MSKSQISAAAADPISAVIALCVGFFLGFIGLSVAPMWIAAVSIRLGSPDTAGMIASLQFAAFGAVSLGTAALVSRFDPRSLAFVGLVVGACGDGASYWAHDFVSLAVCRVVSGLGQGMLLAAVNTITARSRNPQRNYSIMASSSAFVAALCLIGSGFVTKMVGADGIFILMLAISIISIVPVFFLPRSVITGEATSAGGKLSPTILLPLFAYSFYFMGQLSIWSFLSPIGQMKGISIEVISAVLAAGTFAAAIGPIAAAKIGTRFGKTRPLIVGLLITSCAPLLYALPLGLPGYIGAQFIFSFMGQFSLAYFLSVMAAEDVTGRAVAVSPAFLGVGITVGPMIGGFAMTRFGVGGVCVSALFYLCAAMLITLLKDNKSIAAAPNLILAVHD